MASVQTDYDLSDANTLAVPSRAQHFLLVESESDLQTARTYAEWKQLDVLVLGEGSNLVLGAEIEALVLKIELLGMQVNASNHTNSLVELAAGENWHSAVRWSLDQGLSGLENLALIPGSVGAAPVQNIGAYGVELCESLEKLEYFDLITGELCQIDNDQCQFEYRDSRFKKDLLGRAVITRIWLRLQKADTGKEGRADYPILQSYLSEKGLSSSPNNIFTAVCAIRQSRLPDPAQTPNVGSFFHNPVIPAAQYAELLAKHPDMPGYPQPLKLGHSGQPEQEVKVPAAWLIERTGWKGKEQFGVKVSKGHALVLINPNRCAANSVLKMASAIQASVLGEFTIQLSVEPRIYPSQ
jgi:UDP-N-acetylmuramate dehydrogenase